MAFANKQITYGIKKALIMGFFTCPLHYYGQDG